MAVILRAVDDPLESSEAPVVACAEDDLHHTDDHHTDDHHTDDSEARVVIADRYELLGRIGRGATGSVYRAIDRTLDRQVALKLLHPGEHEVADREAQVLARVAHRNVVTIHDYGQSGGQRYLVLELLDGCDFRTWLRGQPSVSEIVENFIEAGRGLSAAHRAGLVHRDFKPSNVLLTRSGRVVVIDFGLARNLDSLLGELEPQRFAEGTLAYMAPERLAGHENDERGDQFAFCVALWEALAGTNPFVGDDPLARFRSIRQGPARVNLGVSRAIVDGIERGMAFNQTERFSTMDELLRELERPLANPARTRGRPVLTAIAVAGTFLVGWGLTPDSPLVEEAYSSLDPTADAALAILESAHKRAADGDVVTAMNDLMYAAELIEGIEKGSESFCAFGHSTPDLAELFVSQRAGLQARLAYAVAIRFAQHCPGLDPSELKFRQEAAHAISWAEGQKPVP